ncbi:MAG: N-acetylmuramoyl-L-alanine amidase, partial [Bacteroidales bacterium]|nr:N-acetylmuramoyl-L-alanine amidase [Bacteroidales bacterium]
MRKINEIIIHCSDTPAGEDFSAADIDRWHKERGWSCIGYHYVVRLDGTIEKGRDLSRAGAHCAGHNANSIGVCYIGGRSARGVAPVTYYDTRTEAQKKALRTLIADL